MHWLEHKYINLLSSKLDKFKRKTSTLYNFRCPICNDSDTNKQKARGYIYEKKGKMSFHCHNCGASASINNFIRQVDNTLYNEMRMESLAEKASTDTKKTELDEFVSKMKKPVFLKTGPLKRLKKISQLNHNHPLKQYVAGRKIPNQYHAKMFLCPKFLHFVNELIPDKFEPKALKYDQPRLLIPFFNQEKNMHALQGRALDKNKNTTKYITIVLDENTPKIYGLDTVDPSEKVYCVEGPIDSMFIPNCVASAGGDVSAVGEEFRDSDLVIIYDNEPRSHETINKIQKAIDKGLSVCIFPDNVVHKDINDMVMCGNSPEAIKKLIDENTFKSLTAKLRLSNWRKV